MIDFQTKAKAVLEKLVDYQISFGYEISTKTGVVKVCAIQDGVIYGVSSTGVEYYAKRENISDESLLGHPCYIDRVLDRAEIGVCWEEEERSEKVVTIYTLWSNVDGGLKVSLQELVRTYPEGNWKEEVEELFDYLYLLFITYGD